MPENRNEQDVSKPLRSIRLPIEDSFSLDMGNIQKTSAKKKKRSINRFETAYDNNDFFLFRRLLRKSKFSDLVPTDNKGRSFHLFSKKADTLSDKLTGENVNLFEKILGSSEFKSAKYICLIWEEYELWRHETILTSVGEASKKLPIYFVTKSEQAQNFFSFLVFDWHNPDEHVAVEGKRYFLELKNKQLIETTNESLFQKLYNIIDFGKVHYDVCLRIIYEYLAEMDARINEGKTAYGTDDLKKLVSIDKLLRMKNKDYKSKILEILVSYWNILGDELLSQKKEILAPETTTNTTNMVTFFQLAFQLIDRKHIQFDTEFEIYINHTKHHYGHYYQTIIKPVARLLLKIAGTQKLSQVESFIFHKCPYVEINSSPLSNFDEFYKFNSKNIFPFNPKELLILKKMETAFEDLEKLNEKEWDKQKKESYENVMLKAFRDSYKLTAHKDTEKPSWSSPPTTRNLLFEHQGRQDAPQDSLFERILSTPGMAPLINVIWDEFELWRKETILKMVSPSERLLIEFVIDSNDDNNLIAFMMPAVAGSDSFVNKKYFLKMHSAQYFQKERKCIFERYLYVKDDTTRDSFFELCFYMFEEMDCIDNIKDQTCIDIALVISNIDEYARDIDFLPDPSQRKLVNDIVNSDEGKEILKRIEDDQEKKFKFKYDCDKLIKYFATYWTKQDPNYVDYKAKLETHSFFFKMITYILEGKQAEFIEKFHGNLDELISSYDKRYGKIKKNELMMLDDLFILFRTAVRNDRKEVVECILKYETFETLDFNIPHYKKADDNNRHAALKLLEQGYSLGERKFPDGWVSEQVMVEFLDSQITVLDQDMVQMNSNFLLRTHARKYKIKSKTDVNNEMVFCDYLESLDFIVQNDSLEDLILHPLLSTYISLKSYKYQKVYKMNFFLFFFMYMLPFGFLITHHSRNEFNEALSEYSLRFLEILCTFSTSLLTFRELLQMIWVSKSFGAYFKRRSNQLEILMIALSWSLLLAMSNLNIDEYLEYFAFLSTLFIAASTAVLLTMLPFESMPLYMMMFKRVATTFLRFFTFFVFILLAFSISFCVIFRSKSTVNRSDSKILSRSSDEKINDEVVYKNFDTWVGSFFKTVLMLSGEYTIEPFTLSPTRMIIFFMFVLTSFVLFNLILGLAVDDVQRLKNEAEILNLRYEAKKFMISAAKWKEIYDNLGLNVKDIKDLVWWKMYPAKIMRALIINYCFIHKIGKIFVNMNTKEVSFEINRKQEAALTRYSGKAKKYFMEQMVFDRLKMILKTRSDMDFEASKKSFSQKTETKILKQQHDQSALLQSILENTNRNDGKVSNAT